MLNCSTQIEALFSNYAKDIGYVIQLISFVCELAGWYSAW